VYFENEKDAEKVINFVNKRTVRNRQITVCYAKNFIDLSDFRTRIEFKIKLENVEFEKRLLHRQLKELAENPSEENLLKINYIREKYGHLGLDFKFSQLQLNQKQDNIENIENLIEENKGDKINKEASEENKQFNTSMKNGNNLETQHKRTKKLLIKTNKKEDSN